MGYLDDYVDDFLYDHKRRGWHFDAVDLMSEIDDIDDLGLAEHLLGALSFAFLLFVLFLWAEGTLPLYEQMVLKAFLKFP